VLPITRLPLLGHGQPFYLTTGYFLKLGLPAFTGLGDEQQNQAVPRLLTVECGSHLPMGINF
jgi:hypothetical protein